MTPDLAPELARLEPVLDATWPAAATFEVGGFRLREGAGGGQRVSAATAIAPVTEAGIAAAEAGMEARGRPPLFRVRSGEAALDAALAARGYVARDETDVLEGPLAPIASHDLPRATAFAIWPPLAIMDELWEAGGIGPGRRAVMNRVAGPKTAILGRLGDHPAGVAFLAAHGDTAMIHAAWVPERFRRQKVAYRMMVCAAIRAQDIGTKRLSVLCLRHNLAANSLYASLGLRLVGRYHYRAI